MIEIVDYKEEHLDSMRERMWAIDVDHLDAVDPARDKIKQTARDGSSYTLLNDGVPVVIGGVYEFWPGVGEIWQLPDPDFQKNMLKYCKIVKGYVDKVCNSKKYHRLQTACPDDTLHNRWMRFLGFDFEGILRKYGPGKMDYVIYARLM